MEEGGKSPNERKGDKKKTMMAAIVCVEGITYLCDPLQEMLETKCCAAQTRQTNFHIVQEDEGGDIELILNVGVLFLVGPILADKTPNRSTAAIAQLSARTLSKKGL